ncbi:hypothetical protein [Saccharothrix variisporea]|uniref:Peptidase inhibitor family I36 n=1 Tax=Saccharothrix variisporea TaxID=543527 RepID=A0A495XKW6_9PSEU|nr:hypothetical protein [Saccharothrix variisporea]RKT74747.1 hypothetical protein DFJ66_8116 [Saccharothrix variisporea]
MREIRRVVAGVVLALTMGAAMGTAHTAEASTDPANVRQQVAAPAPAGESEWVDVAQARLLSSAGETGALSYPAKCFGYEGKFRDGTDVRRVNWTTARDECFGIAPDRTIWHTWPGAGRWHRMPGNGRADNTTGKFWEKANGDRRVAVWVKGGSGNWCQDFIHGKGWTGRWFDC